MPWVPLAILLIAALTAAALALILFPPAEVGDTPPAQEHEARSLTDEADDTAQARPEAPEKTIAP